MDERGIRSFVGWASVAFGVGMLLAPRLAAQSFGVGERVGYVRFLALRDLAIGAGALTQPDLLPWLWARIASDSLTGRFARGRAAMSTLAAVGTVALSLTMVRRLEGNPAKN